jgi:predicted enzyme related to lactoylglutathione lyase
MIAGYTIFLIESGGNLDNNKTDISMQISWVYTQELDSTAEFYADVLGLECIRDEGDARIFATAVSAAIGVCSAFANRVVEPKGGMISIVTDDVDAWYRRITEKGVAVAGPPHRLEQFGIYTFFVTDPNGYVIEFQQFEH